jgi:2-polyprenyl-6-methoxyphenol hydroxylase-like FAD-dependent oxidoreductase
MPHTRRKAAIIGGSLTGLITARLLFNAGWDVHVFERVAETLSGRGAGIGTHPEFFDVLEAAGIAIPDDIGMQVTIRRLLDRQGHVAFEHYYPQVLTHWDRVFSLLKEHVPEDRYHLGKQLVDFAQTDGAVTATFSDGEIFKADLLIGADGIRSTTRCRSTSATSRGAR